MAMSLILISLMKVFAVLTLINFLHRNQSDQCIQVDVTKTALLLVLNSH